VELSVGDTIEVSEAELPVLLDQPAGKLSTKGPHGRFEWRPWKDTDIENRRFGVFVVTLASKEWFRVSLLPTLVLSARGYAEMVAEISTTFPAGVWDLEGDVHVAVKKTRRSEPIRTALQRVVDETRRVLDVARRVARNPAEEFRPPFPAERSMGAKVRATRDLPENRIVLAWAARVDAMLREWLDQIDKTCAALDAEVADATDEGGPPPQWTAEPVKESRNWLKKAAEVRELQREVSTTVAPLRRICRGTDWSMQPSIRRRADPAAVARHLGDLEDGLAPHPGAVQLSTISVRRASFLFELWGAIAVARSIAEAGLVPIGPPVASTHRSVDLGGVMLPRDFHSRGCETALHELRYKLDNCLTSVARQFSPGA
jgi:hypothetical protein